MITYKISRLHYENTSVDCKLYRLARSTWWWSDFRGAFRVAKPNIQKPVESSWRENGTTLLNWIKFSNRSNSFAFRPQFWLLFGKEGLETRIFWNHGTVKEDHLWRWTTLTRKFPLVAKRSSYFLELTKNSGILAQWKATDVAKSCQRSDFRRRKKRHGKACKSVSARCGHKGWQLLFEKCLLQLRTHIPS